MKVFISWSAERSHALAKKLKPWLRVLSTDTDVFLSSRIDPGTFWASEIVDQLNDADSGIVIVTPENQRAQWLNFEAGALAFAAPDRCVPVLFDMDETELEYPLSMFNYVRGDRSGLRDLAGRLFPDEDRDALEQRFRGAWPGLNRSMSKILTQPVASKKRKDSDKLDELVQKVRLLEKRSAPATAVGYAPPPHWRIQEILDELNLTMRTVTAVANRTPQGLEITVPVKGDVSDAFPRSRELGHKFLRDNPEVFVLKIVPETGEPIRYQRRG